MTEDQLLRDSLRLAAEGHEQSLLPGAQARRRAKRRAHRQLAARGTAGLLATASVATLLWSGGILDPLTRNSERSPAAGGARTLGSSPTPAATASPGSDRPFTLRLAQRKTRAEPIIPENSVVLGYTADEGGQESRVYLPDPLNPERTTDFLPRVCGKTPDIIGASWMGVDFRTTSSAEQGVLADPQGIALFPFLSASDAQANLNLFRTYLASCTDGTTTSTGLKLTKPLGQEVLHVTSKSAYPRKPAIQEHLLVRSGRWLLAFSGGTSLAPPSTSLVPPSDDPA
ncbi:MAG: hypothetical protein ACRC0L_04230, partial [Angustibacter sp.]